MATASMPEVRDYVASCLEADRQFLANELTVLDAKYSQIKNPDATDSYTISLQVLSRILSKLDDDADFFDKSQLHVDTLSPRYSQGLLRYALMYLFYPGGGDKSGHLDVLRSTSAYLEPVYADTPFQSSAHVRPDHSAQIDLCEEAEIRFADIVRQVKGEKLAGDEHTQISVYLDRNKTPLGLRKEFEASTMLSLAALQFCDIRMPAGTIFGIGYSAEPTLLNTREVEFTDDGLTKPCTVSVYQFPSDEIPLRPLRHSAFAYSPPDKTLFGIESCTAGSDTVHYSLDRFKTMKKYDINTFADTTRNLLLLCGVTSPTN